jgi:hypothetical protein
MRNTLMTEKIARRGVFVPSEYTADFLSQILVREVASRKVVSLPEHLTLAEVRSRIAEGRPGSGYQGFPVLNDRGQLTGVVTRRDLLDPARMPADLVGALTIKNHAVIFDDNTLSEAGACRSWTTINSARSSELSHAGTSCRRAIGESSKRTNVSGVFAGNLLTVTTKEVLHDQNRAYLRQRVEDYSAG